MTQTPTPPPPAAPAANRDPAPAHVPQSLPGTPLPSRPRFTLAPNWLQIFLIAAILGAAIFVALDERYLWATLLAIAGLAFGTSYVLRRMVGDDYDRT